MHRDNVSGRLAREEERGQTEASPMFSSPDHLEGALAPAPDFRHVGLQPGPGLRTRFALGVAAAGAGVGAGLVELFSTQAALVGGLDRKSTRLNSSHANISY